MSSTSCSIIRDLLPLYCDQALSEDSRALVELHLKECTDCAALQERMKEQITVLPADDIPLTDAWKGFQKALKRTRLHVIAVGFVVVLIIVFLLSWFGFFARQHPIVEQIPPMNNGISDQGRTSTALSTPIIQ